jgi:hypothetical protein
MPQFGTPFGTRFLDGSGARLRGCAIAPSRPGGDKGSRPAARGRTLVLLEQFNIRHTRIHAGRPQANGNAKALRKTILDERWPPRSRATCTGATPRSAASSTHTGTTTTATAATTAAQQTKAG